MKGILPMKKLLCLLLCLCLIAVPISAADIDTTDGFIMSAFFEQLMKVTEAQYRFGVTYEKLIEAALMSFLEEHPEMFAEFAKGAYSILDENSIYLLEAEYAGRMENIIGQFAGIGLQLTKQGERTVVAGILPDASAFDVKVGDVIISVDGEDIHGYDLDRVVSMIRGEEDTFVTLDISSNGEIFAITPRRVNIRVSPVEYENLGENNAGYVRITMFNANTAEYLNAALEDLAAQGVDKIILDLRNNGGGLLQEAVEVASHFLPDNSLVVTETYNNEERDIEHFSLTTAKKFGVVVLVNEYSASASEIVSGAIKDHMAGSLVGVVTFGKGTVQSPIRLLNYDGIWLTVASYRLPNGENIHGKGIDPDYYVENSIGTVDKSKMIPLNITRALQMGDEGEDVYAVKQRLVALGYNFYEPDDVFDERMYDIISDFQKKTDLYVYGVADITTQFAIENGLRYAKEVDDKQMTKALELIMAL